jgi:hypothetical protein
MFVDEGHRGGILVLTAWIEGAGPEGRFRARITRSEFGPEGEQTTSAASRIDEACEVVRAWLTALSDAAE